MRYKGKQRKKTERTSREGSEAKEKGYTIECKKT